MFVETQCARVVISINHQETASGLVILMTEPVFDELYQLTTNIHSLKLLIHTNPSDKYRWVTTPTLQIINRAVQSVSYRLIQMQCLDAIIG